MTLVPVTPDLCRAELIGRDAVGRELRARVPESWPPPVLEANDVERIRGTLASVPAAAEWTLHYMLTVAAGGEKDLVGVAGFAKPPDSDGVVEIGYAVAAEHQRRGFATEAVRALVARAFRAPDVVVVRARTYRTLVPSIAVLEKSGFRVMADVGPSGLLQFERRREDGDLSG